MRSCAKSDASETLNPNENKSRGQLLQFYFPFCLSLTYLQPHLFTPSIYDKCVHWFPVLIVVLDSPPLISHQDLCSCCLHGLPASLLLFFKLSVPCGSGKMFSDVVRVWPHPDLKPPRAALSTPSSFPSPSSSQCSGCHGCPSVLPLLFQGIVSNEKPFHIPDTFTYLPPTLADLDRHSASLSTIPPYISVTFLR